MSRLTHGPLVGAISDQSAAIWLRADGAAQAELRLTSAADLAAGTPARTATAQLAEERDFSAVVTFDELQPDTAYFYRVLLDGQPALFPNFDRQASFRTFPAARAEAPSFSFAFGSCFNSEHNEDVIFNTLVAEDGAVDPRFFLMIGDNTYVDYYARTRHERNSAPVGDLLELYRASYRASWRHARFRQALMRTPTFMIFDDHEIWNNWNNAIDHRHDGDTLRAAQRAYWEYQDCHNPAADRRHAAADPSYHYTFSYGSDVGFFVLDCRMRRNPKAVPFPTILGEAQRVALFRWLKDNKTRYRVKFIVSPVPVSFIALPHTIVKLLHSELGDQWIGYQEERLELFKFIQRERIEGVHFLSGDIHLGQGLTIESVSEEPGPVVYSYTSSPLANAFYLLPEEMPRWFSTLFWVAVGVLLGGLLGALTTLPAFWSMAGGFVAGFVVDRLWRRRRDDTPQFAKQPGRLERLLYRMLRSLAHQYYLQRLMGVARDEIKGGGVHYRTKNMFPAVNEYNMGLVTVTRRPESERLTVHFRLVGARGETLGSEGNAHDV